MNTPEYSIHDLFRSSWDFFSWRQQTRILRTLQVIRTMQGSSPYRGYLINTVLKQLARNSKLLRRLSAEQRVECFYDLPIINGPWLSFPIRKVGKYQAPADKILNFSYQRFKVTDAKFTLYLCLVYDAGEQDHPDHQAIQSELGKFLACLYAPVGGWKEDDLEKHGQRLLRKTAFWERELILETYGHIRNHIIGRFPELFPITGQDEEADPRPVYSGKTWHDMHFDIAETEAFKGFEHAGSSNMYHVLTYLNKLVIRNQKSHATAD